MMQKSFNQMRCSAFNKAVNFGSPELRGSRRSLQMVGICLVPVIMFYGPGDDGTGLSDLL